MIRAPTFAPSHLSPPASPPPQAKDGPGLTQGPVSRELPTCSAGLASQTVRGAWGGGGKEGRVGRSSKVLPPTRQTDLTWFFPGTTAPPNYHTPMPTGLSKRGHARLGGDGPVPWASGGWALWGTEVGRVPEVGWASWHWGTLAGRRGSCLAPHPPLSDNGARSAPLACLAPA